MASLVDVLRALAAGTLSSRAYTDNLIARVRARNERVRAWARLDAERARGKADACDARRAASGLIGPLHGLPVGVKDIFDTADAATERGSPVFAEYRPQRDAAIVERLHAAGGFVLGKTTTTELAYMQPTETRNPWNSAHTPGGSSAGSAAAVAAGFVHAAIGTQTNGSVIRPAAYCGVVGFKPTAGLLPAGGVYLFSPTLDQVGTFARSVNDVALFTAPLAEGESIAGRIEPPARAPALGVITEFPWTTLEQDARDHFVATLQRLAAAGAQIKPIALAPVFGDANLVHRTITLYEAARQHAALQTEYRARLSNVLNDGLDEGRRIAKATYGEMLARRAALIDHAQALFDGCDAIVCPPAAGGAPRRLDTTGDAGFCTLWSLVGVPAITLPTGLNQASVPLGLQLAAPSGADSALLRVAAWVESVLGPLSRGE